MRRRLILDWAHSFHNWQTYIGVEKTRNKQFLLRLTTKWRHLWACLLHNKMISLPLNVIVILLWDIKCSTPIYLTCSANFCVWTYFVKLSLCFCAKKSDISSLKMIQMNRFGFPKTLMVVLLHVTKKKGLPQTPISQSIAKSTPE